MIQTAIREKKIVSHIPEKIREKFTSVLAFQQASELTYPTCHALSHGQLPGRRETWEEVCRVLECQPGDLITYE
jgi:DNA-binding Xre family transcriptional regulator